MLLLFYCSRNLARVGVAVKVTIYIYEVSIITMH